MAYKRYYSIWKDEQDWEYTLYIIPSNANVDPLDPTAPADFDSTFALHALPDDLIMRDMKLNTELGEIPVGLVSQTLEMTLNLASLQGTANYDELREQLLQGSTCKGTEYGVTGVPAIPLNLGEVSFEPDIAFFQKFNTFILMVNDGSGIKPLFIGCQKFSAENELTVNKLSDILSFKIECYDVMRCIGEAITHDMFVSAMVDSVFPVTINYGDSISELSNVDRFRIYLYADNYADSRGNIRQAFDQTPNDIVFFISTFERFREKFQDLFTRYMRGFTWNLSSSISLPIPFVKAWTFYKQRNNHASVPTDAVEKPSYVSEIWGMANGDSGSLKWKVMGGALYDPTAFGKAGNAFEVLKMIVESSLENYKIQYSHSTISGLFSATYTSDFIRPLTASGITFNSENVYGDVKFKLFQETVKSADVSCSTLQGDKDNKTFPYSEQGTSADNGKDLEIVFHNLPSASDRKNDTIKNAINAGMIVYEPFGTKVKKVDSTCSFKYSNTDEIKLQYTDVPSSGTNKPFGQDDAFKAAMIIEQQTAGVPHTIAYALVKALGSSRETELSFKTKHAICGYEDVGSNCTINMNDMNPLITKIYNANSGTAVITKHTLDVFSADVDITARMYTP